MTEGNEEKRYTLKEIKETYLPNRDLASLRSSSEEGIGRETFFNILEKVSRPVDKPRVKGKSKT